MGTAIARLKEEEKDSMNREDLKKRDVNMPGWIPHDVIANMMGISNIISNKTNRFLDDIDPSSEFEAYNTEERISFKRSKKRLSIRGFYSFLMLGKALGKNCKLKEGCLHDRCKNHHIIKMDLEWMLETNRAEYIKPYYLHFVVDYINDRKMPNETAVDIVNIWEQIRRDKYIIPGTEQYLKEVLEFVKFNGIIIDEIIRPFENAKIVGDNDILKLE